MKLKRKNKKGISLIVLVITIIIMIILAATVVISLSQDGIITKAIKASFYQEMKELQLQKDVSKLEDIINKYTQSSNETSFLVKNIEIAELEDLEESLKAEIVYVRNSFGQKERFTTKQVWENNLFNCNQMYEIPEYIEGLSQDIYYINSNMVSSKEKEYIYDRVSDTCFKVNSTRIGKYDVHSLAYAQFIIDGKDVVGLGVVEDDAKAVKFSDGTIAYEPDLRNFSYASEVVYYSPDFKTTHFVTIKEFIQSGKPSTKVVNQQTYTFADYTASGSGKAQVWANVRTVANGLEAYWVWLPRYAYKIDSENKTIEVIFVSTENKPLDTKKYGEELPEGYILHEGFKQKDGLKGIWFSKYDPTPIETVATDKTEPLAPDLTDFNTSNLKLVYYTADGKSSIEKDYSASLTKTIEEGGVTYYWYNYPNKIWANVKTVANGLEAYWVWLPRYAYKLESGTTKVIFVDENNKPIDKATYGEQLPEGFTLHEGFKQKDGLKGIWFSKYDPTKITIKQSTEE